jgi:hypothetical protein
MSNMRQPIGSQITSIIFTFLLPTLPLLAQPMLFH